MQIYDIEVETAYGVKRVVIGADSLIEAENRAYGEYFPNYEAEGQS